LFFAGCGTIHVQLVIVIQQIVHLGTQIVNIVWAPLLETWVIIELHNSHILWKSDDDHPDQQLELEPESIVAELSIIAELKPVAK
jgi:hypothetical protein